MRKAKIEGLILYDRTNEKGGFGAMGCIIAKCMKCRSNPNLQAMRNYSKINGDGSVDGIFCIELHPISKTELKLKQGVLPWGFPLPV
jgi:hypothetical protein